MRAMRIELPTDANSCDDAQSLALRAGNPGDIPGNCGPG
jgi:hypothetical protein